MFEDILKDERILKRSFFNDVKKRDGVITGTIEEIEYSIHNNLDVMKYEEYNTIKGLEKQIGNNGWRRELAASSIHKLLQKIDESDDKCGVVFYLEAAPPQMGAKGIPEIVLRLVTKAVEITDVR